MDLQLISEYAAIVAACGVIAGVVEAFVFLVKLNLLRHVSWLRRTLDDERRRYLVRSGQAPRCPTCGR